MRYKMNIEELKEYNKIVIESAKECAKPWKLTTFILAGLLAGMIVLYFLCPENVSVDQDNLHSVDSININGM